MDGPLDGLRVLDMTWGMPGAVATMLLGDYGAEVIKVERPGGDPARQGTATLDRGKRSVTIDLDDGEDRRVLDGLVAGADVLVESFGPGRLDRWNLSWKDVQVRRPDLVYCSITGYGQDGPDASRPSFDATVAARLGFMSEWGGNREGPIFLGYPALSYSTGLMAAIGILAALRAKLVSGVGDHVDTTLRDGCLAQMGMNWWSERGLSYIKSKGQDGRLGFGNQRLLLGQYEAADGRPLQIHTGAAGAFGRLLTVLGLQDRIASADPRAEGKTPLTDDESAIMATELPAIFRTRPRDEWLELLWANDVAALPVQQPGLVLDDDHVRAIGLVQSVDDPDLGPIETIGPIVKFQPDACWPIAGPRRCSPADGLVVREHGWCAAGWPGHADPAQVIDQPLTGIRILEFSNWFAAPYGNRLLGDLGALVIKVEPMQGDPMRPLPNPWEGGTRAKRSVVIDMKRNESRHLVERLLATTDVVQHNFRPGAAERLAIDYPAVRALNPNVVYGYAPSFGSIGPKSSLQSFAPLLSGFVGATLEAAGEGNPPHTTLGSEDYFNGQVSAFAILLGLVRRERSGEGIFVETPQLHSSLLSISHWYKTSGDLRSTIPHLDHEETGWSPTYRIYQCLIGWICVTCVTEGHRKRLEQAVLDLDLPASSLAESLQDRFVERPAEDWLDVLTEAGVPCEVVREDSWFEEFLGDPAMVESGLVNDYVHPLHGRVRTIGQLFHLAQHPGVATGRSPLFGEHTAAVLREVGLNDDEIADLVAGGVITDAETQPESVSAP